MTVKPILFSGPMVRALLEGRKTQTRRILKPQPICIHDQWPDSPSEMTIDEDGVHCGVCGAGMQLDDRRPSGVRGIPMRFAVGDLLWVREAWQTGMTDNGPQISFRATPDFFPIDAWDGRDEGIGPSFNYARCPKAEFSHWLGDILSNDGPWRPGIFMPRWASRLTLEVTDVRVQRLQEISREDAIAEGATSKPCPTQWRKDDTGWSMSWPESEPAEGWQHVCLLSPQFAFGNLWNKINGEDAWAANPWIVALTFKVHKANVDSLNRQEAAA